MDAFEDANAHTLDRENRMVWEKSEVGHLSPSATTIIKQRWPWDLFPRKLNHYSCLQQISHLESCDLINLLHTFISIYSLNHMTLGHNKGCGKQDTAPPRPITKLYFLGFHHQLPELKKSQEKLEHLQSAKKVQLPYNLALRASMTWLIENVRPHRHVQLAPWWSNTNKDSQTKDGQHWPPKIRNCTGFSLMQHLATILQLWSHPDAKQTVQYSQGLSIRVNIW